MVRAVISPPVDSASSESHNVPHEELFGPLVDRILTATASAIPSSPDHDPSNPDPFLAYWRAVFAKLHDDVVADDSIPDFLSDPPTSKVEVRLFERPAALGCPCCLPEVEAGCVIDNDGGVQKGDVVREMGRWLFAEKEPEVFQDYEYDDGVVYDAPAPADVVVEQEVKASNDEEEIKPERKRVVIYQADWLSGCHGKDGNALDRNKKWLYGRWPEIFLYGCAVEEFEGLKKEMEVPPETVVIDRFEMDKKSAERLGWSPESGSTTERSR